jgi:rod shape-determining protein MreC
MVKRLYHIFQLFRDYFLLALFVVVSIALLSYNDTNQIRALRSFTVLAVGTLQSVFGFVPDYFALSRENTVLRKENLSLSEEVNRLREARLENIRLRQLLDLKQRGEYRYVSANVVGKQQQPLRNSITIDVGERDSVRAGMPIVTEQGLAGRVVSTSSRYAVAQLLQHTDLRVSAKIQRSRVDGIIRWNEGATLLLTNVAKTLDVREGDVVMTSEYSSLFPQGIRIGIVESTRQSPGQLFLDIRVKPAADFARLEEVFVIRFVPDSSRVFLERRLAP